MELQRCVRMIVRQALVEALSRLFREPSSLSALPPLPISYKHLLHTSDAVIQENSRDIYYSVPYILHVCNKARKSSDMRAACIMHLLWPLYIAGTAHTATDALREWIVSKIKRLKRLLGFKKGSLWRWLYSDSARRKRWALTPRHFTLAHIYYTTRVERN